MEFKDLRNEYNFVRSTLIKIINLPFILICVLLLSTGKLHAQLPAGFVAKKLTNDDLRECIAMAHAPDGRIFLAERGGVVKVLSNGSTSILHTVSTTTSSEQGL